VEARALDQASEGGRPLIRKRVMSLIPSPENELLYRPTHDDPGIDSLAERIKKNGCDPLTVTADNYIVSGHRRRAACLHIGQQFVYCHVLPRRRDSWTKDEYIALLRDHNDQRNKTVAEQVREELVDVNPEQAHRRLREMRAKSVNAPERHGVRALEIEGTKKRYNISDAKADHVKYIQKIVEERKEFWPLSVRGVHYQLLNYNFVRGYYCPKRNEPGHGAKQELRYVNDAKSYSATSDLITRLRLDDTLPWEAFDDFTRPLRDFKPFSDVRQFVRQERDNLFGGYWRDLLQTQPNHIEVFCEKNTVYHTVLRVTEKYQITTSSGRGFNSIDPWHDLYERYMDSCKERLILIVLSDYDPEGEQIPQVGGRTLRDDFGIDPDDFQIIKAGVTRQQIIRYGLPAMSFAKESSSNHDWFVERNNGNDAVYELEALEPAQMMNDLDNFIRSVIDIDLFNREVQAEEGEAAYLEAARNKAREALRGLGD
jgi:ParB-like chromosome segregation protein Spo0J